MPNKETSEQRIKTLEAALAECRQKMNVLKASETIFRTLAEESPNMIFINVGGRIVYVNKRCELLLGYTRDEFYSEKFEFLTLIAPEYRELIQANFRKHMGGEEIEPFEYAILSKDGRRIETLLFSQLISYGDHRAIMGIVIDITERKSAETALRESEEKYRRLFENAPVGLGIADETGTLMAFNDAMLIPAGYTRQDIWKIRNIAELYFNPDDRKKILAAAQTQGFIDDAEVQFKRKDGQPYDALLGLRPFQVEGKSCWLAIVQDVTSRKVGEAILRDGRSAASSRSGICEIRNGWRPSSIAPRRWNPSERWPAALHMTSTIC